MFMSAALTDLGQEMKSSDAGIHSANMGGVWQDVVMGFGGIRIRDGHLPYCSKLSKTVGEVYISSLLERKRTSYHSLQRWCGSYKRRGRFRGRDHGSESNCQQRKKRISGIRA